MTDTLSDAELMERTRSGDQAAFRRLSARHIGRAHAVAMRMMHNREDAEEVAQDALAKVWTHAARFDPQRSAFGTWFYRIVANACLDRLRRKRVLQTGIDDVVEPLRDEAPSAEDRLMTAAQSLHVQQAMAELPAQQRLAVVLCYFEDFTQVEAAKVMGMHIKAVEGLLFRAKKSLKTRLSNGLSNDG